MANTWVRNRKSYIELESTLGVLPTGSPDKRLQAWSIGPKPMVNKTAIKPIGNIFRSGHQTGLEWTDIQTVAGEGGSIVVDYNGINYALGSIFSNVSPTNPGTGVYKRVFSPVSTPSSFAVDYGDPAILLQRVLACFFTQISFNANINSLTFSASGKGRRIASGVTGAVSPADIALVVPNPFNAALYLNTTYGSLGTPGDVSKVISNSFMQSFREFTIDTGNLFDVHTVIKPTNTSWETPKPLSADGSAMVALGGDTTAWGYLTQLRNNTTIYGMYEVIGDAIVAGTAEVQTITVTATSGTMDITILGNVLTGVAYNITASALQALINALTTYGASDVTVTLLGGVYTITYPAALGNVAQVVVDGTGLSGGTATPATTTPGVAPLNYFISIEFAGQFPEHFSIDDMDGHSILRLPFSLVQDNNLTGIKVTTQGGIASLAA